MFNAQVHCRLTREPIDTRHRYVHPQARVTRRYQEKYASIVSCIAQVREKLVIFNLTDCEHRKGLSSQKVKVAMQCYPFTSEDWHHNYTARLPYNTKFS